MRNKIFLSILSVVLLSLGWLELSGLSLLISFVPLLYISHSYTSSKRDFLKMFGWVALVMGGWTLVTTWWIWYAAPIGIIAATFISVLLFGAIFMLYHFVSKRVKPTISYFVLICGWIWAEQFYTNGEVSFPWLVLGNGFANDIWAIQWYSVTGTFGGSLWALLCNALIFEVIKNKNLKSIIGASIAVVVPITISLVMFWSYEESEGSDVKVTIIQPNIEPYTEKYKLSFDEQTEIMFSLANEAPEDVDYIIFPETVIGEVGGYIWENNFSASSSVNIFSDFVVDNYPQSQMIVGAMTSRRYDSEARKTTTARDNGNYWYDRFNTALALDATGVVRTHHKSKLVVGVEKMPYKNTLKFLDKFIVNLGGTTGQLGYDEHRRVFHHRSMYHPMGITSATTICYESIYGEHFSEFVANGAQLMFIITNDGWWYDTAGYKQHFSFARLRAIETRRWIGRAANTGISGFISPRGDVVQSLGWDKRGTLTETMRTNNQQTFYVRNGDYIANIAAMMLILTLLSAIAFHFRRKSSKIKIE